MSKYADFLLGCAGKGGTHKNGVSYTGSTLALGASRRSSILRTPTKIGRKKKGTMVFSFRSGISLMVEHQFSKLRAGVRFSYPAHF